MSWAKIRTKVRAIRASFSGFASWKLFGMSQKHIKSDKSVSEANHRETRSDIYSQSESWWYDEEGNEVCEMIEYNGYVGEVEFDDKTSLFLGKVSNCSDLITFQGKSIDALKVSFHFAVNDYLATCAKHGKNPGIHSKYPQRQTP